MKKQRLTPHSSLVSKADIQTGYIQYDEYGGSVYIDQQGIAHEETITIGQRIKDWFIK